MSGWAWAGIGCGALLLIVAVVSGGLVYFGVKKFKQFQSNKELALAEMVIATHPDLEKVSSDPGNGQLTVRTKSGEEYTVNYKELTEGRFSFKDSSGNTTTLGGNRDISEVPAWVPRPPSLSTSSGVFHSVTNGKATGLYNGTSAQPIEDLKVYFETEMTKAGFGAFSSTSSTWGGTQTINRSASTADKELAVTLSQEGSSPVVIQVVYKEK